MEPIPAELEPQILQKIMSALLQRQVIAETQESFGDPFLSPKSSFQSRASTLSLISTTSNSQQRDVSSQESAKLIMFAVQMLDHCTLKLEAAKEEKLRIESEKRQMRRRRESSSD